MIEGTTASAENYYQVLAAYMENRRWSPEEQRDMFRYIGHSTVSAEAVLEVLGKAEDVRGRLDLECLEAPYEPEL